jgi:hypothetical protein
MSLLPIKTEKTIQGTRESNEQISPRVPAVEGIIIKIPAIRPHVAEDLLKSLDLYIVMEIKMSVIALNT